MNKMNHGDLPMTELSRDNLRDFIDFNLGINLKWDRVRASFVSILFI